MKPRKPKMSDLMSPEDYLKHLEEIEYKNVRRVDEDHWAGTVRFNFTEAVILGNFARQWGYEDRWCYEPGCAAVALEEWALRNYEGEPEGWHRHPATGRRVNKETGERYVAF